MRKITKAEFLKAQRVIQTYKIQQQEGKYQFLYWLVDDTEEDNMCEKWIKAKSLDQACNIFLAWKTSNVVRVDYEVYFNGTYIDITNRSGFEDLI